MKWEAWQGTIPTSKGPMAMEGKRLGPLLVSSRIVRTPNVTPDTHSIDHIPSGVHIFGVPMGQQKLAKGIVIDLLALDGMDWETPNLHPTSDQLARMWEVCHPPPKRKIPKAKAKKEPLVLVPIYPHTFTPSPDLVAYDALNVKAVAEGKWFPYLRESARLLGKEVMVAKFTAGRKAPLLKEDVYEYLGIKGSRAYASPLLPPGFPGGYAGCRQIVEGLWKLGGVIDALADCMVTYWETQEMVGFSLPQWATWEAEFKSLIIKGWQNWSLAAALFDQLPKEDQAKITGVLGHVGSDGDYHDLGLKTFLRSPHLPTLRRYRRLRLIGAEAAYEELT